METMKNLKTYLLASAVLFASSAFAQPTPPSAPPPQGGQQQQKGDGQNRPEPKEISGTVESFNKSPRGSVDAVIVTADGTKVQINLAPDLAGAVTKNIAVGDTIKAMVLPEKPPQAPQGGPDQQGPQGGQGQQPKGPPPKDGAQGGDQQAGGNPPPPPPQPKGDAAATQNAGGNPPPPPKADHDVYHAVAVTDAKGTTYGSPDGPPKPQTAHLESKIKSPNFDRQGIVNGFTLDSGELVLVPPPEGKKLNLKVGDSVKVDGNVLPNNNNATVIAATNINGTEIQTPRPPQQQQQNGPGQQQQGNMQNQQQGQQGQGGPGQPMGQQQGGQNQQQQRPPMGPRPGGQGGQGGGQQPMPPGGGGQRGPQGMAPMGGAPRG